MKASSDIMEVKGFLGTINFYKKFVLECAKESNSLIELTHKKRREKLIFV